MPRLHLPVLVLSGTVVIVAAGCGGSSSSSAPGGGTSSQAAAGSGGAAKTVTIEESEFKLSPSSVSAAKPGILVLKAVNKGSITHALEIEGQGLEQKTGDIAPGSSATLEVTITKAGSYELYCPIDGHKDKGMKGELVVGGSGGGGTTTGTTTGSSGGYGY